MAKRREKQEKYVTRYPGDRWNPNPPPSITRESAPTRNPIVEFVKAVSPLFTMLGLGPTIYPQHK